MYSMTGSCETFHILVDHRQGPRKWRNYVHFRCAAVTTHGPWKTNLRVKNRPSLRFAADAFVLHEKKSSGQEFSIASQSYVQRGPTTGWSSLGPWQKCRKIYCWLHCLINYGLWRDTNTHTHTFHKSLIVVMHGRCWHGKGLYGKWGMQADKWLVETWKICFDFWVLHFPMVLVPVRIVNLCCDWWALCGIIVGVIFKF